VIRSCWVNQSNVGRRFRRVARLVFAGTLTVAVIGCSGPSAIVSPSTTPTGGSSLGAPLTPSSASPRLAAQTAASTPGHGGFSLTGSMAVARADPTATLLDDGSVLIFGGCSCPTAELYEPATGVFVPTGPMNVIRTGGETATLLQDGLVLVTGGDDDSPASKALASAELYDPKAGTFRLTGSMTTARTYHTATLLPDGQVLVAGGFDSSGAALDTAELYDPATGEFVSTSHMGQAFDGHTATLLADGRVLVVGGNASCVQEMPLASAELYDPATGTFSPTGSMATARDGQSATRLGDGRVLIAGGDNNTAELYDPGAGTFSPTGSMKVARASQTATLLADGLVLLAGGADDVADGASAELYQP